MAGILLEVQSFTFSTTEVSVQDLIKLYFSPEVLERKCEECGGNRARAESRLVGLPRVFVLYLKRHSYDQTRSAGKCKTKVLIPPEICFTDHVKESVSPPVEVSPADQSLEDLFLFPLPSLSSPSGSGHSPPSSNTFRVLSPENLMSLSEQEQVAYTMNLSLNQDSQGHTSAGSTTKRKLEDFLTDDEGDFSTPRARSSSARKAEEPLSPEEEERNFQKALEISKHEYQEDFFRLRHVDCKSF